MSIFVFKKQLIGSLLISLFLNLHAEIMEWFDR